MLEMWFQESWAYISELISLVIQTILETVA